MAGNERHNPTSAKHDETTLNIRETEKNKGKKTVVKIVFFKKERVKVNLIKKNLLWTCFTLSLSSLIFQI